MPLALKSSTLHYVYYFVSLSLFDLRAFVRLCLIPAVSKLTALLLPKGRGPGQALSSSISAFDIVAWRLRAGPARPGKAVSAFMLRSTDLCYCWKPFGRGCDERTLGRLT